MANSKNSLGEQERRLRIDATVFSDQHPQLFSMMSGLKANIRGASLLSFALEASKSIQITASHLYRMASESSKSSRCDHEIAIRLNRYVDKDEYQTLLQQLDAVPLLRGTHIVELAAAGLAAAQGKAPTVLENKPAATPSRAAESSVDEQVEAAILVTTEQKKPGLPRGMDLGMFSMKGKLPPRK